MQNDDSASTRSTDRRAFLKSGIVAAGAASAGVGLPASRAFAEDDDGDHGEISRGDVAILRFLAAAEIIESDLWQAI